MDLEVCSLYSAVCLFLPTWKDSSLLMWTGLFPSFALLCSVLVHEYPAILFIQLPMSRHLSCLHIVPWAFFTLLPRGHVCRSGMVGWKVCPAFQEGPYQFTPSTSPAWVFLVHHFFPDTWCFRTLNFLHQTFLGKKRSLSLHLLAASTLSLNPLSCPKAVILKHIRIAWKAG